MIAGRHQELLERLRDLAERSAAAVGAEVVDVALRGPTRRRLLRVDIDRAGAGGIDLEDCRQVSLSLGAALDDADLFPGRYVLEVSSPGVDRPIRTADDFRRNTGRRVVVTAQVEVAGQRRFRGRLGGVQQGRVLVDDDRLGEIEIPLEHVASARQDVEF